MYQEYDTWSNKYNNPSFLVVYSPSTEEVTGGVLEEKVFLEISLNSQENGKIPLPEALAQVLSCEFCKIFKNTFFTEHLRVTASASSK